MIFKYNFYIYNLIIKKKINKILRKNFLFKIEKSFNFYKMYIFNNEINIILLYAK